MAKHANVMKIAAVLVFLAAFAGSANAQGGMMGGEIPVRDYFYVDAVHGNDNNAGLTPAAAFATIQKAIDTAADGDMVLVYPGLYQEEINFLGKAIIVQGVVLGTAGVPVIHNPGDFAVSFYSGENPDSVLKNFIIRDSFMAVFIAGSAPTISNLTIVKNTYGIEAYNVYNIIGMEFYRDIEPDISNIIFWNNTGGDIFGCQARYSCISEGAKGEGNITTDPLFVDPNAGDYHLLSTRGRYWPEHNVWILDRVSSLCIDGGDPSADPMDEPVPNGGRINIGAYGGTVQASMSPDLLPGQAFNPHPANGAVEVDINPTLSWNPGLDAVEHDIYFGTEDPPQFVGSRHTMEGWAKMQFNPGILEIDTVYYWRVDQIDSKGNKTAGALWRFTTSYTQAPPPPPKGRTCFVAETEVWVDESLVSISNVAQGQINCGINSPGKIQEVQEHNGTFTCYDVLLESGNCLGVAGNHYFMTESGRWISLLNLKAGIELKTSKGSIGIKSVTRRPTPYTGKVYNLKVEGSDRYIVGKDAVIVRDY